MKVLFNMISHGHVAEAAQYLSDLLSVEGYPFDAVLQAIGSAKDDETRLRILRAAIGAMRRQDASGQGDTLFKGSGWFSRMFVRWWRLLPADEGTEVVRDLVRRILAQPDGPIRASAQDVRFSSTREYCLFEILEPLQRLDPDLAGSLIREYPQLAAAAAHYPYGHESIEAAARERTAQQPPRPVVEQPDCIMVGRRLIPMPEALRTDFQQAFDLALRLYAHEVETHLGGTYALNVHSEALSTRGFLHVLCDKLGLVVAPGRREISMLVARQG